MEITVRLIKTRSEEELDKAHRLGMPHPKVEYYETVLSVSSEEVRQYYKDDEGMLNIRIGNDWWIANETDELTMKLKLTVG